ncbi:MAG: hypothetical protein Kow0068_20340 [Marinilabiliales bacterium]
MRKIVCVAVLAVISVNLFSQSNSGQIHGNFQTDFQYYNEDTLIGAKVPAEIMGINSFANFNYTNGNFSTGLRYEGYFPPLNGFDKRYKGVGIPYKYLQYNDGQLDVTVGDFYEQFGSGLILRAYEERNLGYDNAFQGIKVNYNPIDGIYLKGLVGNQRNFWSKGEGIVRGIDGEISLNELIKKFSDSKTSVLIGGSFVSKYQDGSSNPFYNLPDNVGAGAGRFNIAHGKFNFSGEYAYKINDPSADNHMIFKPGEAFLFNASYSQKGLGILLGLKRIDNMSFRSDRNAAQSSLNINYIPDLSKAHAYSLAAMYPYATQLNGESAAMADITYTIKKGTTLGGKYGTTISINYSRVTDISRDSVLAGDTVMVLGDEGTYGYKSNMGYFFDELMNEEIFYQDFNIVVTKKFSKKVKSVFQLMYQEYNNDVIHGAVDWHGHIYAGIAVADVTYKFTSKKAVRIELQHLNTEQQYGNWFSGLIEFTIPHWFFTVVDQYNYGNSDPEMAIHYPKTAIGYTKGTTRVQIGYGKQREGVMCIGGVCRNVPASNGLTLTISSSF